MGLGTLLIAISGRSLQSRHVSSDVFDSGQRVLRHERLLSRRCMYVCMYVGVSQIDAGSPEQS